MVCVLRCGSWMKHVCRYVEKPNDVKLGFKGWLLRGCAHCASLSGTEPNSPTRYFVNGAVSSVEVEQESRSSSVAPIYYDSQSRL